MHFAYINPNNTLILEGHNLETVDEEKDLGVMIRKDLKASSQCVKIKNCKLNFRYDQENIHL